MEGVDFAVLLVAMSILPPLIFAAWVRNREAHRPEPWGSILRAFLYGAVIGTSVALLLNVLFDTATYYYGIDTGLSAGFITTVIAAPFIEELTKGAGLSLQRNMILELEDGLVYGAAIGLGFAATENMLYGFTAYFEHGSGVALQTVILRTISSTILHASASALLGFGYSRAVLQNEVGFAQVLPFYLLAVALHAAYNILVGIGHIWALFMAIVMVWFVMSSAKKRIEQLDAMPHELK